MKKILSIMTVATVVLMLGACSKATEQKNETAKQQESVLYSESDFIKFDGQGTTKVAKIHYDSPWSLSISPSSEWISCEVSKIESGLDYLRISCGYNPNSSDREVFITLTNDKGKQITLIVFQSSTDYVDLGLPSGTLWKIYNEPGYYDFVNAVQAFGNEIPTKEQCEELRVYCTWQWSGWNTNDDSPEGYTIKGQNGASIFLPNLGMISIKQNYARYGYGQSGRYWISSDTGVPYFLSTYRTYCDGDITQEEDRIGIYDDPEGLYQGNVRLVK